METNADRVSPASPSPLQRLRGLQLTGRLSLSNIRVSSKLYLLAGTFAVPVAVLLSLVVVQQQQDVNTIKNELRGLEALGPITTLTPLLQEHGDLALRLRTGDQQASKMREDTAANITAAIKQLETTATNHPEWQLDKAVYQLQLAWQALDTPIAFGDANATIHDHTAIVKNALFEVSNLLNQNTGLALDQGLASSRTQELVAAGLPELQQKLGELRMLVRAASAKGQWVSYRERLRSELLLARSMLADINRTVQYAQQADAKVAGTVGQGVSTLTGDATTFLDSIGSALEQKTLPASDAKNLDAVAVEALAATKKLATIAETELKRMLSERAGQVSHQRFLTLTLVMAVLLLATLLLIAVTRAITQPLKQLSSAASGLSRGELNVYADVRGADEIGSVAKTFNEAVAKLRETELRNAEEREAALELQQNINEFLEVTMSIAEGDLTKRGRVSEDVLGNVVDATNVALDEIAQVLQEVQRVAMQVNDSAGSVSAASSTLTSAARDQAEQAESMQAQTLKFTSVFRDTATRVDETARAAERTLTASQHGQTVVQETRRGLEELRTEMQDISGSMTQLVERSVEISEIAETITTFASQTTLLALGASLEAAGAGEAGKRFMVVAEGVRQLAEDSAQAAYRVDSVVKGMQTEIQQLAQRVRVGAQGVNSGYEVAARAGELLREIETLADQSTRIAYQISNATHEQVDEAELVSRAVQSITTTATQTQAESERSLQYAEKLNELARQLSAQLARFRLS